ncbi:hypothetical protein IFM89_018589 [Coptis chinensis]|uniref:Uncharacterized protein n=1 Tax=Coptis chinensis TaxID=261450 RepID=A0A835I529_9MAGN|nr:hypothetical protein IFM89_018589 [Coptis chinensis]
MVGKQLPCFYLWFAGKCQRIIYGGYQEAPKIRGYCYFTGAFKDPDIIHVDDSVDPVRDLEVITEELRLKADEPVEGMLFLLTLATKAFV